MTLSLAAALAAAAVAAPAAPAAVPPLAAPGPAAAPPAPPTRVISLQEAFALTAQRSEDLASRRAAAAEALARADEMIGTIKPHIALVGTELIQDTAGTQGGFSSSFNQRSRLDARLTARQPIFSGFRDFLALSSARALGKARGFELDRARSRLFEDVAAAYVDLLARQREIGIRVALLDITADRVKDLRARLAIGRSRRSEILAAESSLARREAQVAEARGAEQVSQETLRFLTGLSSDLAPEDLQAPAETPLEPFLSRAQARADVETRRKEAESARFLIGFASRERWPSVGLDGNYYMKRSGVQTGVDWDILFTVDLPLYSGGTIGARTRQAEARLTAAEQALSLASRAAEREVRTAHRELTSALTSLRAMEKAAAAAEADAKAQAEDYKLGQVVNLDVLGALDALQEARLAAEQTRLRAVAARLRLEAAAGGTGAAP